MDHRETEQKADGSPITFQEETVQVLNPTLAKVLQENKPNPLDRGHWKLYAICGLLYLSSTMTGVYPLPSLFSCHS